MLYALIIIGLALSCWAATLFFYMIFVRTVHHFDNRRVEELELRLRRAEQELAIKNRRLEIAEQHLELNGEEIDEEEFWPEIIDG